METLSWNFQEKRKEGDIMANLSLSAWRASIRSHSEDLLREAIQNSCQELQEGQKKVKIRVNLKRLSEDESEKLADFLDIEEPRRKGFKLDWPTQLYILSIEDFNTNGLNGVENIHESEKRSNFVGLVRDMGNPEIAAGRPGSHGIGSGTYWANSKARTVLFYSRFMPTEETKQVHTRFMAASMFGNQSKYNGRAWFGIKEADDYTKPVINDKAIQIIEEELDFLDIKTRKGEPNDTSLHGTTVIIPAFIENPDIAAHNFPLAIQKHFWPRLITNRLDIEVYLNGQPIKIGNPLNRDDLRPYIRAYNLINDYKETGQEPEDEHAFVSKVEYKDHNLGHVAAIHLTDRIDKEDDELFVSTDKVCMFRDWGMVVQYKDYNQEVPYVAVFEASEEIDEILAKAEPQAHDEWDEESTELTEDEGKVVHNIWKKSRDSIHNFLKKFYQHFAEGEDCPDLSKKLAELIPLTKGKGVKPPQPRPVSIQYINQPTPKLNNSGHKFIESSIFVEPIWSRIDFDENTTGMKIFIKPIILWDDDSRSTEYLELDEVKINGQKYEFNSDKGYAEIEIGRLTNLDRPQKIDISTKPILEEDISIEFETEVEFEEGRYE